MSAKGCIGVIEIGSVDDNIDNVDWLASTDVSCNPHNKQNTDETSDTRLKAICSIQQKQRSQVTQE